MKQNYRLTMIACFIGYIAQAIINNFAPLLFVMFETSYAIPLSKITLLITINFLVQLFVDLATASLVDRIGQRPVAIFAHILSAAGLILLTILPDLLPDAYTGLLIAVIVYAFGGGLIEVLLSPILEACPTDNKETAMSLLHSFYCWGHVGVVLLSTVFFSVFGIQCWRILAIVWALVPLGNAILFAKVPLYSLQSSDTPGLTFRQLFSLRIFWLMMLMMLCAGAAEQAVSQWASAFAEQGLGVSKTVGDLAGPMAFAVLMGISRLIFSKYGERLDLRRFIRFSCVLCLLAYLCIALVPSPVVGLIGCAVCGFSVGIFWPGTLSCASAAIRGGGTAMFALLALAGDLGCSGGPTLAGLVSSAAGNNLRAGILAAIIFPVLLLAGSLLLGRTAKKNAL